MDDESKVTVPGGENDKKNFFIRHGFWPTFTVRNYEQATECPLLFNFTLECPMCSGGFHFSARNLLDFNDHMPCPDCPFTGAVKFHGEAYAMMVRAEASNPQPAAGQPKTPTPTSPQFRFEGYRLEEKLLEMSCPQCFALSRSYLDPTTPDKAALVWACKHCDFSGTIEGTEAFAKFLGGEFQQNGVPFDPRFGPGSYREKGEIRSILRGGELVLLGGGEREAPATDYAMLRPVLPEPTTLTIDLKLDPVVLHLVRDRVHALPAAIDRFVQDWLNKTRAEEEEKRRQR